LSPNAIKVTLEVGSAPYQKTLAPSLAAAGMLRRVLNLGLCLEIQEPGCDGALEVIKRYPFVQLVNRILWGIWRRLPHSLRGQPPVVVSAWLNDWLVSKWIEPSTIFHGYTGLCLASLRVAKRQGAIALVEQGSRHPRDWRQSAIEECRRFGVDPAEAGDVFPEALIRRIEREYEICDHIVVPSTFAYESFVQWGYGKKALIVPTGVDTQFFFPPKAQERPSVFRACYVGRIELTKGMGYLLQAWKRLALPNAELLLVGEVKPDVSSLLQSCADSNIRTVGFSSLSEVARYYRQASLFVFPSVNEGLAQVLLEAMASGLAVVATDRSGACDCVTHRKEGFIIPAQDVEAIADALLWCYQHPEEVGEMGNAARARVQSQFTLEHYNRRIMALYRSLVPPKTGSSPNLEINGGPIQKANSRT